MKYLRGPEKLIKSEGPLGSPNIELFSKNTPASMAEGDVSDILITQESTNTAGVYKLTESGATKYDETSGFYTTDSADKVGLITISSFSPLDKSFAIAFLPDIGKEQYSPYLGSIGATSIKGATGFRSGLSVDLSVSNPDAPLMLNPAPVWPSSYPYSNKGFDALTNPSNGSPITGKLVCTSKQGHPQAYEFPTDGKDFYSKSYSVLPYRSFEFAGTMSSGGVPITRDKDGVPILDSDLTDVSQVSCFLDNTGLPISAPEGVTIAKDADKAIKLFPGGIAKMELVDPDRSILENITPLLSFGMALTEVASPTGNLTAIKAAIDNGSQITLGASANPLWVNINAGSGLITLGTSKESSWQVGKPLFLSYLTPGGRVTGKSLYYSSLQQSASTERTSSIQRIGDTHASGRVCYFGDLGTSVVPGTVRVKMDGVSLKEGLDYIVMPLSGIIKFLTVTAGRQWSDGIEVLVDYTPTFRVNLFIEQEADSSIKALVVGASTMVSSVYSGKRTGYIFVEAWAPKIPKINAALSTNSQDVLKELIGSDKLGDELIAEANAIVTRYRDVLAVDSKKKRFVDLSYEEQHIIGERAVGSEGATLSLLDTTLSTGDKLGSVSINTGGKVVSTFAAGTFSHTATQENLGECAVAEGLTIIMSTRSSENLYQGAAAQINYLRTLKGKLPYGPVVLYSPVIVTGSTMLAIDGFDADGTGPDHDGNERADTFFKPGALIALKSPQASVFRSRVVRSKAIRLWEGINDRYSPFYTEVRLDTPTPKDLKDVIFYATKMGVAYKVEALPDEVEAGKYRRKFTLKGLGSLPANQHLSFFDDTTAYTGSSVVFTNTPASGLGSTLQLPLFNTIGDLISGSYVIPGALSRGPASGDTYPVFKKGSSVVTIYGAGGVVPLPGNTIGLYFEETGKPLKLVQYMMVRSVKDLGSGAHELSLDGSLTDDVTTVINFGSFYLEGDTSLALVAPVRPLRFPVGTVEPDHDSILVTEGVIKVGTGDYSEILEESLVSGSLEPLHDMGQNLYATSKRDLWSSGPILVKTEGTTVTPIPGASLTPEGFIKLPAGKTVQSGCKYSLYYWGQSEVSPSYVKIAYAVPFTESKITYKSLGKEQWVCKAVTPVALKDEVHRDWVLWNKDPKHNSIDESWESGKFSRDARFWLRDAALAYQATLLTARASRETVLRYAALSSLSGPKALKQSIHHIDDSDINCQLYPLDIYTTAGPLRSNQLGVLSRDFRMKLTAIGSLVEFQGPISSTQSLFYATPAAETAEAPLLPLTRVPSTYTAAAASGSNNAMRVKDSDVPALADLDYKFSSGNFIRLPMELSDLSNHKYVAMLLPGTDPEWKEYRYSDRLTPGKSFSEVFSSVSYLLDQTNLSRSVSNLGDLLSYELTSAGHPGWRTRTVSSALDSRPCLVVKGPHAIVLHEDSEIEVDTRECYYTNSYILKSKQSFLGIPLAAIVRLHRTLKAMDDYSKKFHSAPIRSGALIEDSELIATGSIVRLTHLFSFTLEAPVPCLASEASLVTHPILGGAASNPTLDTKASDWEYHNGDTFVRKPYGGLEEYQAASNINSSSNTLYFFIPTVGVPDRYTLKVWEVPEGYFNETVFAPELAAVTGKLSFTAGGKQLLPPTTWGLPARASWFQFIVDHLATPAIPLAGPSGVCVLDLANDPVDLLVLKDLVPEVTDTTAKAEAAALLGVQDKLCEDYSVSYRLYLQRMAVK